MTFQTYSDFLAQDVVKNLLLSSVQLLRSKDREVIKSALAFSKVCAGGLVCYSIYRIFLNRSRGSYFFQ